MHLRVIIMETKYVTEDEMTQGEKIRIMLLSKRKKDEK